MGGTPGFAPPEQYGQVSDYTDARSDIYALGATLYTILTGKIPPESIALMQGLKLLPVHQVNPSISRATSNAIQMAMQVKKEMRFQSAREFKLALQGMSAKKTINIVLKKPKREKWRNLAWILSSSLLILIMATAVGVSLIPSFLPSSNPTTSTASLKGAQVFSPSSIPLLPIQNISSVGTSSQTAILTETITVTSSSALTQTLTVTFTPTITETPSPVSTELPTPTAISTDTPMPTSTTTDIPSPTWTSIPTRTDNPTRTVAPIEYDFERFFINYFALLDDQQYKDSYAMLSAAFQKKQKYPDYVSSWERYTKVDLINSEVIPQTETMVCVKTKSRYFWKTGLITINNVTYKLIKDSAKNMWLIDLATDSICETIK